MKLNYLFLILFLFIGLASATTIINLPDCEPQLDIKTNTVLSGDCIRYEFTPTEVKMENRFDMPDMAMGEKNTVQIGFEDQLTAVDGDSDWFGIIGFFRRLFGDEAYKLNWDWTCTNEVDTRIENIYFDENGESLGYISEEFGIEYKAFPTRTVETKYIKCEGVLDKNKFNSKMVWTFYEDSPVKFDLFIDSTLYTRTLKLDFDKTVERTNNESILKSSGFKILMNDIDSNKWNSNIINDILVFDSVLGGTSLELDPTISSLPYTISTSNDNYVLSGDISVTGTSGIIFDATVQNTTLNCLGYYIQVTGVAGTTGANGGLHVDGGNGGAGGIATAVTFDGFNNTIIDCDIRATGGAGGNGGSGGYGNDYASPPNCVGGNGGHGANGGIAYGVLYYADNSSIIDTDIIVRPGNGGAGGTGGRGGYSSYDSCDGGDGGHGANGGSMLSLYLYLSSNNTLDNVYIQAVESSGGAGGRGGDNNPWTSSASSYGGDGAYGGSTGGISVINSYYNYDYLNITSFASDAFTGQGGAGGWGGSMARRNPGIGGAGGSIAASDYFVFASGYTTTIDNVIYGATTPYSGGSGGYGGGGFQGTGQIGGVGGSVGPVVVFQGDYELSNSWVLTSGSTAGNGGRGSSISYPGSGGNGGNGGSTGEVILFNGGSLQNVTVSNSRSGNGGTGGDGGTGDYPPGNGGNGGTSGNTTLLYNVLNANQIYITNGPTTGFGGSGGAGGYSPSYGTYGSAGVPGNSGWSFVIRGGTNTSNYSQIYVIDPQTGSPGTGGIKGKAVILQGETGSVTVNDSVFNVTQDYSIYLHTNYTAYLNNVWVNYSGLRVGTGSNIIINNSLYVESVYTGVIVNVSNVTDYTNEEQSKMVNITRETSFWIVTGNYNESGYNNNTPHNISGKLGAVVNSTLIDMSNPDQYLFLYLDVPGANGEACLVGADCISIYCNNNICCDSGTCCSDPGVRAECSYGYICSYSNNCGGSLGAPCLINGDCISSYCNNGFCCNSGTCCPTIGSDVGCSGGLTCGPLNNCTTAPNGHECIYGYTCSSGYCS